MVAMEASESREAEFGLGTGGGGMDFHMGNEGLKKLARTLRPSFPDPDSCRTRHAFGSYWTCLNENNFACPHKFGFGFEYLCRHESRADMAAKQE